jgi:hypothetical protein
VSITVSTDVFCDRCPTWIRGVSGRVHSAAIDARAVAKSYGWRRVDGLDICPACLAVPTEE